MDQQHAGDQKSNDAEQGVTSTISEKDRSKSSNDEGEEGGLANQVVDKKGGSAGMEEEEKGGSAGKEKEPCMNQQHAGNQKCNDAGQGVTLPTSEKDSIKTSNN